MRLESTSDSRVRAREAYVASSVPRALRWLANADNSIANRVLRVSRWNSQSAQSGCGAASAFACCSRLSSTRRRIKAMNRSSIVRK